MKDEQHPAQGLISLARAYGDLSCFGSDIKLGSYINLRIDTATKHRSNIGDRYSSQKSIIQVRLTYHQFAELITSFGRGDGVPCTIEAVNGKRIEQYENADSTIVDFKTDHDAVLEEIGKQISSLREQLEAISESSRVRKKDVASLVSLASRLHTNFEHNLSYVQERFDEQMELKYHGTFRHHTGSLQFLGSWTRSDLQFSIQRLSDLSGNAKKFLKFLRISNVECCRRTSKN